MRKTLRLSLLLFIVGLFSILIIKSNQMYKADAHVPYLSARSTLAPVQERYVWYTVRPGDSIIKIAQGLGVPWEEIVIANEKVLAANMDDYCEGKPTSYTHNPMRRGHFCNFLVTSENGEPLVHANTLKPGDELRIPVHAAGMRGSL